MIEIILGIIGIIEAPIFFFMGAHYGKKHSKDVIKELKQQKEQNTKLSEKVDELNSQNDDLSGKIGELEHQNTEQKEMLEKSIQAVGALNKQNEMLINKVGSLESQISLKVSTPSVQKKGSEINKLLGELGFYLAKEYGKKKIDEWLYPED